MLVPSDLKPLRESDWLVLLSESTQWHGLMHHWLIWSGHCMSVCLGFLKPLYQCGSEDSQSSECAQLSSHWVFFWQEYAIPHCCKECVNRENLKSICEWIAYDFFPGRWITHSVDVHHSHTHTHTPCVKGVIVEAEVTSGWHSICNTSLHKDLLSSRTKHSSHSWMVIWSIMHTLTFVCIAYWSLLCLLLCKAGTSRWSVWFILKVV